MNPKRNKSPKSPLKVENIRQKQENQQKQLQQQIQINKALADNAYGNVFPVARGGSSYNRATNIDRNKRSLYSGVITAKIQKINAVIESRGYKLLNEIGKGNYANVYSTVDKNNKIVALKVIDLEKASVNYRLKFLPRELKIMSRVRHPNIVSIYSILQSSNAIYILMEYAPNGTIGHFISRNGAIKESQCKPMFKQILEGVHYMHSYGMSHRDIKVENILLTHKFKPKLTDFSYSKAEDLKNGKRDLSRTFCGSLPYLPPEMIQMQSYDPLVSDIWSLGITLYVMLCDALPFSITNLSLMLDRQLSKNWKFHSRVSNSLSDSVKNIMSVMLQPDVKIRKTTSSLLLHQWIR
jgi:serine/threonine protein kinase